MLRYGRLTVPELVRRINTPVGGRQHAQSSRKSSLAPHDKSDPNAIPVRLIQQALVVLIQHHCVQHSRPSGSHSYADEEFFEVDVDEVLCRLRFGNYMSLAQEWGGDDVRALCLTGRLKTSFASFYTMDKCVPETWWTH